MSKKIKGIGFCLFFLFLFCLWSGTVEAVTLLQAEQAAKRFSAGRDHSLMIQPDGQVIAWGDNTYGQAIDGLDRDDRGYHQELASGIIAVSAGYYHNLALTSEGTVFAWGADGEAGIINKGQCDYGDKLVDVIVTAISAGGFHSLALTNEGTVIAWGDDDDGQCDYEDKLDGVTVKAISAGGNFSMALLTDGSIVVWGDNTYNQIDGAPSGNGFRAISAGGTHCLAIDKNNKVVAWGDDARFKCSGVPDDLLDVVAVAAGETFSVALTCGAETVSCWGDIAEYSSVHVQAIAAGGSHALTVYRNYSSNSAKIIGWGDNSFGKLSIPSDAFLTGRVKNVSFEVEGIPYSISPNFSKNVYGHWTSESSYTYIINVPVGTKSVDVMAIAEFPEIQEFIVGIYQEPSTDQVITSEEFAFIPVETGFNRIDLRVYLDNSLLGRNLYFRYVFYVNVEKASTQLENLQTNVMALEPAFDLDEFKYTGTVNKYDSDEIEITATPADSEALVAIGLKNEAFPLEDDFSSGEKTESVNLGYGKNEVQVVVRAAGEDDQPYDLEIIKPGFLVDVRAPGGELMAAGLKIVEGELSPAFRPDVFDYSVVVNSDVTHLTIDGNPTEDHKLWVGDTEYKGESIPVLLTSGSHQKIKLEVRIPDTDYTRTYTLVVNRVHDTELTGDNFMGTGTKDDPYLIYNLYTLQEIANSPALRGQEEGSKYFQLACDLEASHTEHWNNGLGFKPIGTAGASFTGYFDGNGHVIKGLRINRLDMDNVGLFGYTAGAEITNLGLVDCQIVGIDHVGTLVGYGSSTVLENCYSSGQVNGNEAVGGLVGSVFGVDPNDYYLKNCYSSVDVTGQNKSGGLIGEIRYGKIRSCYSVGQVDDGVNDVGGLVGAATSANHLYCYWNQDASGQTTSALGSGKTTIELKQEGTYDSYEWDFTSVWCLTEGVSYPSLKIFSEALLSPLVDDSLILWLDGKHGSNLIRTWQDLSGKGNNGALSSNFFDKSGTGWTGEGLKFFPGSGSVTVTGNEMFNLQNMTVTLLVTPHDMTGNQYFIRRRIGEKVAWQIYRNTTITLNHLYFYQRLFKLNGLEHTRVEHQSHFVFNLNLVNEITMTFNEQGNMQIYRDGVSIYNEECADFICWVNEVGDIILPGRYTVHHILLYNRPLGSTEVTQNYQYGLQKTEALTEAKLEELSITPGEFESPFKVNNKKQNYEVVLDERGVNSVNVYAKPLNPNANVSINGEFLGTGARAYDVEILDEFKIIPIVVQEQDQAATTKTYQIQVAKRGYLDSLVITNPFTNNELFGADDFSPNVFEYNLEVPHNVTALNITAVKEASVQDFYIGNFLGSSGYPVPISLKDGINTIPIKLSGRGYKTEYVLNVYRAIPATLQELSFNLGALAPKFSPEEDEYNLDLRDLARTPDSISITAKSFSTQDQVSIVGMDVSHSGGFTDELIPLVSGENEIVVRVENEGEGGQCTTNSYTITIERQVTLDSLSIEDVATGSAIDMEQNFDKDVLEYYAEAKKEENPIKLNYTVANGVDVTIFYNGVEQTGDTMNIINLQPSPLQNLIKIKAEIANKSSREYELRIVCEPSNVLLDELKVLYNESEDIVNWESTFNSDESSYFLMLNKAVDAIELQARTQESEAMVSIRELVRENLVMWFDGQQEEANSDETTWRDFSGNGNNGTLYGGCTWTGDGLEFDGNDDYVELIKPLNIFSNAFTVEMWLSHEGEKRGILLGDYNLGGINVNFEITEGNKLRLYWAGLSDIYGTVNVPPNQLNHIVFIRDKASNKFYSYVNGELDINYSGSLADKTATVHHRLGRDLRSGTTALKGIINSVRIYNRALTLDEINQNYQFDMERYKHQCSIPVSLQAGENKVTVIVQGEDGISTKKYYLNIVRPGGLNTLELVGCNFTDFAKDVNEYELVSNVFLIEVTPEPDQGVQKLFINLNNSATDIEWVSGSETLKLKDGSNRVEIKLNITTPSGYMPTNTYILNIDVDPLVKIETVNISDWGDGALAEIGSVLGAQVQGKLAFNLSKDVNELDIKFNLPPSLFIDQVIALRESGEPLTPHGCSIIENVPVGEEAKIGNNVIKISRELEANKNYQIEFLLSNEPIKLKVGLDSFTDVASGNVLPLETDPLEIIYYDLPKLD